MAKSQFSLTWDTHKNNICNGLSSLQQNGEFVDMTLAADGHLVKVHQVVMALASPFVKELISTAQCPHPVLFLNKISYVTLCSILEYIYTGEVLVSLEHLDEFAQAGRELHIRGLEDMALDKSTPTSACMPRPLLWATPKAEEPAMTTEALEDDYCYFEVGSSKEDSAVTRQSDSEVTVSRNTDNASLEAPADQTQDVPMKEDYLILQGEGTADDYSAAEKHSSPNAVTGGSGASMMQYTVSNQGSLQMILNRFVYYLKHSNRDGSRQWRCVDYLRASRCPALIFTQSDAVVQRIASHTHAFHDKRILKKLRDGAVYSALCDAEADVGGRRAAKRPRSDGE